MDFRRFNEERERAAAELEAQWAELLPHLRDMQKHMETLRQYYPFEETSVDDAFYFEAKPSDSSSATGFAKEHLNNYVFHWATSDRSDSPRKQDWQARPALAGAGNCMVVTFEKPGRKVVRVGVEHREIPKRKLETSQVYYLLVRRSRYTTLAAMFTRNSWLEILLVMLVTSLIALNTLFQRNGGWLFGLPGDYLNAFILGATAKTGQEALKSVPDWLSTTFNSIGQHKPSGPSSPTEGKK